jgi:hypothetical protein
MDARRCFAPPTPTATRAISCSPRRREQLDLLRFPLGDLPKPRVRELAHEFGLAVADKADSQDICFVPAGKYTDVIEKLRPGAAEPGDIVHVDGRVLGKHRGIIHYTIGQRRGLGLTDNAATRGEPLFVVKLDAQTSRVIVGPREALETRIVSLRDVNWIGDGAIARRFPPLAIEIAVRTRSTRPPVPAHPVPRRRFGTCGIACAGDRRLARTGLRLLRLDRRTRAGAGRRASSARQSRLWRLAGAPEAGMSSIEKKTGGDITHAHVEDAYARWAPIYDRVFTAVMKPGRLAAAEAVNRVGGRVLDVGVGTGLELPMFHRRQKHRRHRSFGADAGDRQEARGGAGADECRGSLLVMDAMNLEFPDASFDAAVAPYVITTVPDPARTMDEMARVVKPGGELIIVNHIRSYFRPDRLDRGPDGEARREAGLAADLPLGNHRRLDRIAQRSRS